MTLHHFPTAPRHSEDWSEFGPDAFGGVCPDTWETIRLVPGFRWTVYHNLTRAERDAADLFRAFGAPVLEAALLQAAHRAYAVPLWALPEFEDVVAVRAAGALGADFARQRRQWRAHWRRLHATPQTLRAEWTAAGAAAGVEAVRWVREAMGRPTFQWGIAGR